MTTGRSRGRPGREVANDVAAVSPAVIRASSTGGSSAAPAESTGEWVRSSVGQASTLPDPAASTVPTKPRRSPPETGPLAR